MSIGEVFICQPSVYLSSYDWRVLARRMMNEGMQIADGPVLLYSEYMTSQINLYSNNIIRFQLYLLLYILQNNLYLNIWTVNNQ